MGCLNNCGWCCFLLSIWGVIQLTIMGIFYKIEATPMVLDVKEKTYSNYQEFIKGTKENFKKVAMNCWTAAGMYAFMIIVSLLCIMRANAIEKQASKNLEDDEYVCGPLDNPARHRRKSWK